MCDCISYNRPEWGGSQQEAVLPYRKYFSQSGPDTVCVDACLADSMERIWAAGIETMASCCGHNGKSHLANGFANVMLKHPKDAQAAFEILAAEDRPWWIVMWAGE